METLAVAFRCSQDGRAFRAVLTKDAALGKYRIEKLLPGMAVTASSSGKSAGAALESAKNLTGDLFDWSAWYCLPCGYGKQGGNDFVKCGKCEELVCGAGIREMDGIRTFACHKRCGNTGRIEGNIDSYGAHQMMPTGPSGPALGSGRTNPQLRGGEQPPLLPPR